MVTLEKHLRDSAFTIRNPLKGCIRRNMWTINEPMSWFEVKKSALLSMIATQHELTTPIGTYSFWMYDSTVIDIYGGDYRGWWEEEMVKEWCLVKRFTGLTLRPYLYIIQSIRSDMRFYCHNVGSQPLKDETIDIIADNLISAANSHPPQRIAKNNQRAYISCKYCPVKRECDTTDSSQPQGKADWGKSYPFP